MIWPFWVVGTVILALSCSDDEKVPPSNTAGLGGTATSAGSSGAANAGTSTVTAGTGGTASTIDGGGGAGRNGGAGGLDDSAGGRDGSAGGDSSPGGGASSAGGGDGGAGGSAPQADGVIAKDQLTPTGIAVDASYVYWANRDAGTIVKCPLAGCGGNQPTVLATNIGQPLGLTVDADKFYWMTPSGKASSCPLSGCTGVPEQLFQLAQVNRAVDVHVHNGDVYLAGWPNLGVCEAADCNEDGPTLFARTPAISVDSNADRLFVATNSSAFSCSLDGCLDQAGVGSVRAVGISVDATHVYFAESDYLMLSGVTIVPAVSRCPLAGCAGDPPEVVASGEVSPFGVVATDTRIFYTNYAHGTVVSMPKP